MNDMRKKLVKIVKYTGEMELLSGLSIIGNSSDLGIGGADSEVIKNPITKMPYIPGSSLKGKLRSLLELKEGKYNSYKNKRGDIIGEPCSCGKCDICKIFGAHKNPKASSAPTRIIVRDCELTDESLHLIEELPLESGNFLEEKTENWVDRNNGKAGSPRVIERVPSSLKFNVEIILQIFEDDKEEIFKNKINEALKLLQDNYLGGNGSRGYGHVKFEGHWTDETL